MVLEYYYCAKTKKISTKEKIRDKGQDLTEQDRPGICPFQRSGYSVTNLLFLEVKPTVVC